MRRSFSTNIVDVQKVWFWTFFRQSYIKYHFSWEWFIGSHSSLVFQECNRNRIFVCLDSAWRYHYVFVLVQLKSVFIKIWEVIAVFTYCAVGKAWWSEYRRCKGRYLIQLSIMRRKMVLKEDPNECLFYDRTEPDRPDMPYLS